MDPNQKLAALKATFQSNWEQASDPVLRLILLRNLFHAVHHLMNESLATREEAAPGLDELHRDLSSLGDRLTQSSPTELKRLLLETQQPWPLIRDQLPLKLVKPEWPDMPGPLLQPGREWERVIYSLGTTNGWLSQRDDLKIERPEQLEKWIQEARTPPDLSLPKKMRVILALEKNHLEPQSWWLHSLRAPS